MLTLTSSLTRVIKKVTWAIIKRWPHTLIIPFVVFGLLVGLGVWGVFAAADNEAQHQRNTATGVMTDAATGFEVRAGFVFACSSACTHSVLITRAPCPGRSGCIRMHGVQRDMRVLAWLCLALTCVPRGLWSLLLCVPCPPRQHSSALSCVRPADHCTTCLTIITQLTCITCYVCAPDQALRFLFCTRRYSCRRLSPRL